MPPKRTPIGERTNTPPPAPRSSAALHTLLGNEAQRHEIIEVPLRSIMPNRWQPRTNPSDESLHELAQSIQQYGILEPIIVRPIELTLYEGTGRQYELIAGERRWRAAALADIPTVPARVLPADTSDQLMLELAITENLQRADLHPLDEATALKRMQDELGYSYTQIGERLGKSKGYVQNRLRLLQLDDDLRALVLARPDTIGHVYELARLPNAASRAALVAAVRDDALSRAETRQRVQQLLAPDTPATESAPADNPAPTAHTRNPVASPANPQPFERVTTTTGGGSWDGSGAVQFQEYAPSSGVDPSWVTYLLMAMERTQQGLHRNRTRFADLDDETAHALLVALQELVSELTGASEELFAHPAIRDANDNAGAKEDRQ